MSSTILVALETETPFDPDLLDRVLFMWPGMCSLSRKDYEPVGFRYPNGAGEFAQLFLAPEGDALWLEDGFEAALEFCVWLQAHYPHSLTAFNSGYSFHLMLKDFATAEALIAAALAAERNAAGSDS